MAKTSTTVTLSKTAWTKIADSGVTYMLSVISGFAWLRYSASDPTAAVTDGHPFQADDTFGESASTNDTNVWMRARQVSVSTPTPDTIVVVSKTT